MAQVAPGVPMDDAQGCVPVALEIPGGEPTQRKWTREMAEFMEPMRTTCVRKDWDGLTYEFPLRLYTCEPMPGRSKPTNRHFRFFLDGPFVEGEKGIAPIEKEFADRVAQFWMLYFLEEYKRAHADRVIGRAEYMNALNTFAKQDTMYFKSALQRRSLAQSKGHLTGHGPRQAQACFGTLRFEFVFRFDCSFVSSFSTQADVCQFSRLQIVCTFWANDFPLSLVDHFSQGF